ncbi:retrovirus-related Pol polyprotein from transposon 412 [Trichonephila clavipes]|nr:retrovirus-related Pol polyprotein from transposon 412 [Trichonephila clavipes]
MAYLGKGRKSDLSYIAEQLGERVTDDLKIIDLRNLIVNSTNYDEEFVREMLNVRIEERLEGNTSRKNPETTWDDFYYELQTYFEGWIAGLGITTFKHLKDLMITDQLKKKAPIEFKEHHLDEWSGIISPVDLTHKIEEYEDVRKTFQKKVTWSYSKDTMKKKWNNSTIIPRENVSMNNPINTREHKNRNNHQDFEKRRRPQCFECGSYDHFRPQCPKLKKYGSETINRLKINFENASFDPYTIRGKVNGFEMPILRDTGASIDIICEKFITPNMFTGENVWVQHILDEHMTCLPLAEVEIDCEWGHVVTKAAVVRKQLDQGRYILGNRTIERLESDLEHNSLLRREIVNAIQTRSQWKKEAEQNRTSEAVEKEEMKLEENLAEDIKNLLPLFTEEKDTHTMSLININTDEFIEAQQKSEELAPLIQKIEKGMNNEASDYSLTKGKLLIKSRKDKNGDIRQLLVIPEKFRSSILKMGHEGTSGHLGVTKTKSRIARYFYWPQCYKEIEEFVKTCDPCQRAGKANDQKKAPIQLVPVISEVFSKLNVDAVGPLPTTPTGNKYLLTVMCMSSKYPDEVPMPDIGSTTVVEALFQIFSRMGFPKEIQTDQGTSFTSILTSVFFENFGINVVRSSVYHPQSNPVERFHRTLKRILKVICIESSPEWEKQLPAALFALKTITHESTGFTPAELVHGKNLRTPITLLYENWMGTTEELTPVVEYVFQLINRLKSCQELAIEKMEETKIKRKA